MSKAPFLQSLSKRCFETFNGKFERLTVIFPNKRAGLYFSKHLAALIDQPVWAPKVMSLEEFVFEQSSYQLADELQLNLMLYQVYCQLNPKAESFDHFFSWGEMILKDFNDIDNYLVDPVHIFQVIKNQKELDESFQFLSEKEQEIIQRFWKSFLPNPTKTQRDFLKTWEILKELYQQFHEQLDAEKLAYKGKLFRQTAEQFTMRQVKGEVIWFAGFNALTIAEESIIKACLDWNGSDIFWDIDSYYVDDDKQESGTFFRAYAKDHHFANSIKRDLKATLANTQAVVEEAAASLVIPQIKYGAQKLSELLAQGVAPTDIAVILPNETFLTPLLQNLTNLVNPVNVSMGLSIGNTRVFKFLMSILKLHAKNGEQDSIRFDDLFLLLGYSDLCGIRDEAAKEFKMNSIKNNRIYLKKNDVLEKLPELQNYFFDSRHTSEVLSGMISIAKTLPHKVEGLELAGLAQILKQFKMIEKGILEHGVNLDIKSLQRLFVKMGHAIKVTLSGDAFAGVQIMGALETRNLTFKHIIVMGMNEGNWPAESSNSSFIPFNIRKAFELPVQAHQDAMQAYLFYRLFHGAEQLTFTYNNISSFNLNGEPSRYLKQLQFEQPGLNLQKTIIANPIVVDPPESIVIEKDQEVLNQLNQYLINGAARQKRLSPSAINTYLDCRLKFYFNYVEGIKEPDEINEDMDPSLFGNLMHNTMEFLYEPYVGKMVSQSEVAKLVNQMEPAIERAFEKEKLTLKGSHVGRQAIAHEVIRQFITAILKYDETHAEFKIKALEATHHTTTRNIEINGSVQQVGLKGIIDRIDEKDGKTRVLDYKSGRDERRLGKIENLLDREATNRQKAAFQLLYYCMLVDDCTDIHPEDIVPGLFNSADLFKKDFSVYLKKERGYLHHYAEVKNGFLKVFDELLDEIFDPLVSFDQTNDERKCGYCYFKAVCMR